MCSSFCTYKYKQTDTPELVVFCGFVKPKLRFAIQVRYFFLNDKNLSVIILIFHHLHKSLIKPSLGGFFSQFE